MVAGELATRDDLLPDEVNYDLVKMVRRKRSQRPVGRMNGILKCGLRCWEGDNQRNLYRAAVGEALRRTLG